MEQLRLLVTSSKGGIGKSTVAAGLARTMRASGRRVLLVDCDWGNASLDLLLGAEDRVLFTMSDLVAERVEPEGLLLRLAPPEDVSRRRRRSRNGSPAPDGGELLFAPAPRTGCQEPDGAALARAILSLEEACRPDAVILDTAAGISLPPALCRALPVQALVVTSQMPTALRAAENTSRTLREAGAAGVRLVINNFTSEGIRRGRRPGILSVIDQTETRVIGVVPADPLLASAQEEGRFPECRRSPAAAAMANIGRRLREENVPLFTGVKGWRLPRLL